MWEILGIEPTTDIHAIKSAYAKLAKKYNPEEQPEEFQRLHAAYKSACSFAKSMGNFRKTVSYKENYEEEKPPSEPVTDEKAEDTEPSFDFSSIDILPDYDLPTEKRVEKMLDNIRLILSDNEKRDSIHCWKWLFQKDDFGLIADDHKFRSEAEELFSEALFSPETASFIASAFGRGTRAIPNGKNSLGQEQWRIWISKSGKKAPVRGYKMPSYAPSYDDQPKSFIYTATEKIIGIFLILIIIFLIICGLIIFFHSSQGGEYPKPAETTAATRSGEMGNITVYIDENDRISGTEKKE